MQETFNLKLLCVEEGSSGPHSQSTILTPNVLCSPCMTGQSSRAEHLHLGSIADGGRDGVWLSQVDRNERNAACCVSRQQPISNRGP
jgi:hypothetical protein